MFDKIVKLSVIWAAITFAYIILAFTHSSWDALASNATGTMATQNMTGIVGIEEALNSSNYWKWVIPGMVGIVSSVVVLREEIMSRVRGNE